MSAPSLPTQAPAPWKVGLALLLVYLCWSTTYLAIAVGVQTIPPMLFGGVRVALAGIVLAIGLRFSGSFRLPSGQALLGAWLAGSLLFVGGNGLINTGQKTVPSGLASVLVATCPLFLALLEMLMPRGDRLPMMSWIGLLAGLIGVGILGSRIDPQTTTATAFGVLCCLGSSLTWAMGSVLSRHWPARMPLLQNAAWQMLLGGSTMTLTGVVIGELAHIGPESITTGAIFAVFWLLVVGSLSGFVSYVWLLGHTSAAVAGNYAYVNPGLAILLGWALAGEKVTTNIVLGLAIILAGVALVRAGKRAEQPIPQSDPNLVVPSPDSTENPAAIEPDRLPARA